MAKVELIMPKMGESITEATILKWNKNVGDAVEEDEAVLEIATDKVDSEVPSTSAGIISEILFQEGDVVEVGKAIAVIATGGEQPAETVAPAAQATVVEPPSPAPAPVAAANVQSGNSAVAARSGSETAVSSNGTNGRFYSPLVLNIARTEGLAMEVLESIPGSGKNNRVTKKDILAFLSNQTQETVAPATVATEATKAIPSEAAVTSSNPSIPLAPGDEIVEMDRMRKLIAEHMVRSKHTSPHVTSFVEADVTNMVMWRERVKKDFEAKEGTKITFTPLFMEAVIKAIKDFRLINCQLDGDNIIMKKDINIGMATALPSGNLIVPVIKKADQMNLVGLANHVNDLAGRARENKLKPDDVEGGTFTLTNVGTFGNLMGTPIIFQPQVAILATGAIKKKPVVIEGASGDVIGIRHMMYLSHSYDHRIIDGALGGAFVRRVADYLEQWDVNREV